MTDTEMISIFKCLADKSRLLIVKSLAREDMYVERLAERLNLTPATVSFHLRKLEDIGAVASFKEQYYTMYSLRPEVFSFRVIDQLLNSASADDAQDERDRAYRQKVLSTFFVYGKLIKIPAQRKKRMIVLEEICKSFKPDTAYKEKEVNVIISEFHDDFCTIRREMIDVGLMSRQDGIYRKISDRAK